MYMVHGTCVDVVLTKLDECRCPEICIYVACLDLKAKCRFVNVIT